MEENGENYEDTRACMVIHAISVHQEIQIPKAVFASWSQMQQLSSSERIQKYRVSSLHR